VYVNYGSKEDFDELKAKGVDLHGKIAIARYGWVFRGLKVMMSGLYSDSLLTILSIGEGSPRSWRYRRVSRLKVARKPH